MRYIVPLACLWYLGFLAGASFQVLRPFLKTPVSPQALGVAFFCGLTVLALLCAVLHQVTRRVGGDHGRLPPPNSHLFR